MMYVLDEDIRRRYMRSLVNFFDLYQPLVDRWAVFDNTGISPRKIASLMDQGIEINDNAWYDSMKHKAVDYGHNPKE